LGLPSHAHLLRTSLGAHLQRPKGLRRLGREQPTEPTLSMKGSLDARRRQNVLEPFLGGRGAGPRAERSPGRAQRSTRAWGTPLTSPSFSSPVFSSVLTHPCTGVRLVLLERPIYPFGLAWIRSCCRFATGFTRPMISSGAGGPLTKRSEGPTYVRTATIGCSSWPVPGRDLPAIPFAARRKPRGCFPRPGRGGGVSV